jgi:glyoxylase-like metal-dependent hydrolase (beta-lactamase superfamily II)
MLAFPAFYERPPGPMPLPLLRALAARRRRWFSLPIPCFLVEHPTEGPILVDAGMHADVATDVAGHLGRAAATMFDIEMRPEWAAPAQLRERGIDPAGVRTIVMTHLHYDHSSGLSQFPGATVVVDERELEVARRGRLLEGYRRELLPDTVSWRVVAHEEDAVDVLGDGSIVLLSTPGHTAGHRSVVLRVGDGELLLTGDAAYATRTLDERLTPVLTWRDEPSRRSLDRLIAWRDAHPGAPVVCGHDPEGWARLPSVYGW